MISWRGLRASSALVAATTTFRVNPAEGMVMVIMGQVLPNDADLLQKVETLVYQALVDTP